MQINIKVLRVGLMVFLSHGGEAQVCSFKISPLHEAFATFCPGILSNPCCNASFYLNENAVTLDHITQFHRQCSRDYHPDKNPGEEAEEKMKQCNGGREILENHFDCLAQDKTYRTWILRIWPLEQYFKDCRNAWGVPLTEADLQQKQETIKAVFRRARSGAFEL